MTPLPLRIMIHKQELDLGLQKPSMYELRNLVQGNEVFRYSFEMNVHKDYDITAVETYFDKICDKWSEEFIERPEVLFWGEVMFGVVYKITYIVRNPEDILGKGSDFTHEMSRFHFEVKNS